MKRYFSLMVIFLFIAKANAIETIVTSCDAGFTAKDNHNSIVIEHNGRVVKELTINHDIYGGTFSSDNSLLAIYGSPKK